ncbi:MAG: DnaD domain protein [Anaerolineae bacterium]|nr:DnaD domain protein [Anaerolineae bacterium]MDH7473999.1 DnaD domain protein [Anaerolineae bacterium]
MGSTPLPNPFFSELLPVIDDLAELKITLHCFWLLHQKTGEIRYVTRRELASDSLLLEALRVTGQPPERALEAGLERAVARGTFLHVIARHDTDEEHCYFMNTAHGRRIVERIRNGELRLPEEGLQGKLEVQRPNIFVLYEQNIGLLQPLLADELRDAEQTYPANWIEEAFHIAAQNNVRRWSYVRRILERWAAEGKGETGRRDEENRKRYIRGEYGDYIKH